MMYTLRPIVTSTVAHPCVGSMYEMRNIQGDDEVLRYRCNDETETAVTTTITAATTTTTTMTTTTTTTTMLPPSYDSTKMPDVTEQSTSPDYNTLAIRQEEILKQLADLKAQIFTLCKFLKRSSQETMRKKILSEILCEKVMEDQESQEPIEVSLVLNINPWKPPYSIYALQKLWKDTNIIVKSYVHSTIVGRVPIDFSSNTHPGVNNVVNLNIIFKAVNDVEVVTNLLRYPLLGEVNFLRYLSRLIKTHNYEKDFASACTIDNILDLCCRVRSQTIRDKTDEALSILYQELEHTRWNGRDEPSIADMAAWSTVKQFSSNRRLPQIIQRWYEICEKTFMDDASRR
ncbi:probable aminoacyl tRNA synthase complex-interacting multifunctional protein 2 isoform X2 [Harpegnathos saltator]|uniref:probable aminoacyl tRNA synthase complex-interacting multifunctional protein 2 isoform X2 n=1 Tax=Harpegnathos saltator TaxID=610380 RepID=UPI00058D00C9|nr:probable aminoacyl tRNA synthase complex-interacting multifunctional protein 2 isoform X2 [Harpegnathos saltator]